MCPAHVRAHHKAHARETESERGREPSVLPLRACVRACWHLLACKRDAHTLHHQGGAQKWKKIPLHVRTLLRNRHYAGCAFGDCGSRPSRKKMNKKQKTLSQHPRRKNTPPLRPPKSQKQTTLARVSFVHVLQHTLAGEDGRHARVPSSSSL